MARRNRPPRPGALTELPPLKILTQILLLQTIWYVVGTGLILFTALVAGRQFSFDLVLSWRSLRGDTTVGWMLGLVWLLNSFVGYVLSISLPQILPLYVRKLIVISSVVSLLFFISRSKLIPDFALTIHFIHLVITSLYSHSIPRNWLWWTLQITSAALMISLGMWSCQWRELRPITFGGTAASGTSAKSINTAAESASNNGDSAGDEEMGFGRGRSRGRGADGAGEYEMVGMKASQAA